MLRKLILILFCYCFQRRCLASLSDMVYYNIPSESFRMCYRRLNASHQFGCSTPNGGETGFVHWVNKDEDMVWVSEQRDKDIRIVNVLDIHHPNFNTYLEQLLDMGKDVIAGILINYTHPITSSVKPFSPDLPSPNKYQGLYPDPKKWNPHGQSLLFTDLPFPIALVTNADNLHRLLLCYQQANFDKDKQQSQLRCPYCAVNMRSVMKAASNSSICMRRSYMPIRKHLLPSLCEGMGQPNLMSTLHAWPTSKVDKVVLLVARMDSTSLFADVAPGLTAVTSTVAMYACMNLLQRHKHLFRNHHVLFVLFNGETFNYMGSSKFLYDLHQSSSSSSSENNYVDWDDGPEFLKHFDVNSIDLVIELGHLLSPHEHKSNNANAKAPVYAHYNPETVSLLPSLTSISNSGVEVLDAGAGELPSSSLQPFLRANPSIKTIYLSNFQDRFLTNFYNSFADSGELYGWYYNETDDITEETATSSYISHTATVASCFLYKYLTGDTQCDSLAPANATLVAHILNCFTRRLNCSLFADLLLTDPANVHKLNPHLDDKNVMVMYEYIYSDIYLLNYALTCRLLGEMMEEEECIKAKAAKDKENDAVHYKWQLVDGQKKCFKHHVYEHVVYSPNLRFNATDMVVDEMYPGWTESYWSHDAFSIQIFYVPCWKQELKTLLLGVMVVLLSVIACVLFKVREVKEEGTIEGLEPIPRDTEVTADTASSVERETAQVVA